MIAEQYNTSDDTLARLQNIHGMFDKAIAEDKPKLVKQEKTDPSEKLLEKLNVYENCDGSVDEKQIEKLRKEYFEGLQFNTLQTALELFQNPAAEARVVKEQSAAAPLVSKGTIGDIRSVFINAITSDDTINVSDSLTDEQWLGSSNESRIRKLLTLSLPYLRSYQEMADDLVLDTLRSVFSNVAADLESLSTREDITDRQWFWGINEDRVEQLLQKAVDKSNQIAKDQINADMWCKIRAAFMHCVSSTAALYNKHSKAKTDFSDIGSVQGLTDSKIEQILAETTKEYRRKNKELDVKVVEGITAELKNQIQAAITHQSDQERKTSDTEKPEKLSPERLNKIIAEFNKQAHVESSKIDMTLFEGLTSTIKERIMQEINKEQKINRTVESIDVEPGTASSARQKLMEAYEGDRTRTSSQSTPQSIDRERLDLFTKLAETQEGRTTEWVPDVEVQKGLAQERVRSLMQGPGERAETDWTPDVPISSGLAKERASRLTSSKEQNGPAKTWTPEVPLESGIAKDRAAQIVAAAAQPQTTSQWVPDVPVTSGVVGQRAESFLKDSVTESRDWKPDIELTPGLTKERIKTLYEDRRNVVDDHLESKDAADLIHAGLAKERLNEFNKPSEAKQAKEWEPEVELRKGLTKERTSLFHNLEALQNQQTTSASAERPKVPLLGSGGQRVVVEVENEPLPQDPNVTRGGVSTEQAQVEAGFTKLIINKLKNAYDADEEKKNALKSNQNIREELSMNEGHAKTLRAKFSGFEQDAKTIHTTVEKQTTVPRRFVDKPAPTPIQCEIVTEEKCLCCKQSVYSTEGIKIQNLGYVHKKCMRCPRCNKIPPIAEAVFQNGHIFCTEHKEANV